MTHCVLHIGYVFMAALSGSAIGTFLVVRFWKTGELDVSGSAGAPQDRA